jgi:DNA-binding Lrp family transcriptional regulator
LAILGGVPKIGKSYLALQIAIAVSSGGEVFGEEVEKSPVLYIAYEDSYRRLKERLHDQGITDPKELHFELYDIDQAQEKIGYLNERGIGVIEELIRTRGFGLVIIDTLGRAINKKHNDYNEMTQTLKPLHKLASDTQTAILLIDHFNKKDWNQDLTNRISGSTAKTGNADTNWGLFKEGNSYILKIEGRDINSTELSVKRNEELYQWVLADDEPIPVKELGYLKHLVCEFLKDSPDSTNKEIADGIEKDKGNIHKVLKSLFEDGSIDRKPVGNGYVYFLTG